MKMHLCLAEAIHSKKVQEKEKPSQGGACTCLSVMRKAMTLASIRHIKMVKIEQNKLQHARACSDSQNKLAGFCATLNYSLEVHDTESLPAGAVLAKP